MDQVHNWTDEQLEKLERRISKEFSKALEQVTKNLNDFLKGFEKEDARYRKMVEDGTRTEEQYLKWRRDKVMDSKRFRALVQRLSSEVTNANQSAMAIVNGKLPDIYAENFNYGTYQVESASACDTMFTLYDRDTVYNLLSNDPDLYPQATVDGPKDKLWNRQHITSTVTQGLLQGESMDKIADRMQRVVGMDRASANRAARSCVTAAENSGRIQSYRRALDMGIELQKTWIATLDSRTRASHRQLDGESVPVEEKFSNGLMYPGDPSGPASEYYNCRCTLIPELKGTPYDPGSRWTREENFNYDEWKKGIDRK